MWRSYTYNRTGETLMSIKPAPAALLFTLFALIVPVAHAQKAPATSLPEPAVRAQPSGDLGFRIELTERRLRTDAPFDAELIVQDVARDSARARRFEEYEGDVSGRVLGAWSLAARLQGDNPAKLDSIAERVLRHQNADGSFGKDQRSDGWDQWGRQVFGHGRLLVGLVQYHRLTDDARALEAAQRLGDYFARSYPEWTTLHEGNPWEVEHPLGYADVDDRVTNRRQFIKTHKTSILEGLVMLYEATSDERYLEAGRGVAALIPEFGVYHSHSYLNSLVGLAMLYKHTGDPALFQQLREAYWKQITPRASRPDGAVYEWYPADHRTEGCSVTDWLRLNLWMWTLTQDATYLDVAERVYLNALALHQTANGAFGHAWLTPDGYEARYVESWWCCLMHGLYGYAEAVRYAVAAQEDDVWVNFFMPLEAQLEAGGQPLEVSIETDYPESGLIRVRFDLEQPREFTAHLRLPSWATEAEVRVNEQPAAGTIEEGEWTMRRRWETGDVVELRLPVGLRIEDNQGNPLLARRALGDGLHPAFFFHGPLLLGADERWNASLPSVIFIGEEGPRKLQADSSSANALAYPHARYALPASTGDELGEVVLVPMGAQTGYRSWTDQWRHFRRNGEEPIERTRVRIKHQVQIAGEE